MIQSRLNGKKHGVSVTLFLIINQNASNHSFGYVNILEDTYDVFYIYVRIVRKKGCSYARRNSK